MPDSGGVSLVPAFTGLGAPWWDRRAVGVLTGLSAGTERGHVARAALEAVAHQITDVVEALDTTGLRVLHADGGATASRPLMQIQADLLGRDVVVSANAEVSALGAALMGFGRLGWPLPGAGSAGRRYTPAIDEAARRSARDQWREAMARSRLSPAAT